MHWPTSVPKAIRPIIIVVGVLLVLLASEGPLGAQAAKTTVCTITVNSANEKDAFQRNLPKDKFDFVELLERGRGDWLAAACQQKVQCDVLVISGHFGGDATVHTESATEFYSDRVGASDFLPVDEMERLSCSESCPGLFSRLKAVYLFGCETLSPQASQATSAEIARTLTRAGYSPTEADQMRRALNESHSESNRDRMRRIFSEVPVIYGFSSVAPLGPAASSLLDRYFHSSTSNEVGDGHVSQKFLDAFSGHSIAVASGVTSSDRQANYRRDVCQFLDERLSAAQTLTFIHQVLGREMIDVRMFFDRIENFLTSLEEGERQTPAVMRALAEIGSDQAARERYLAFVHKSAPAPTRARMIEVAHTLGWLSEDEKRAEIVRMIDERMADNAMTLADVDLVCSLNKDGDVGQELKHLELSQSDRLMYTAGLACLGNVAARARILQALSSPREEEVATARVYLRHHPLTDADEFRVVVSRIARMPRSPAQVRALESLAEQPISDAESLNGLVRLFPAADSLDVQRAIAGILIRSDFDAIDRPALVVVLRQNRIKSTDGEDLIDALIRRLEQPEAAPPDASYAKLAPGTANDIGPETTGVILGCSASARTTSARDCDLLETGGKAPPTSALGTSSAP